MSRFVRWALVLSVGYALLCLWLDDSASVTNPAVGATVAMLLSLWELYTYQSRTVEASYAAETASVEALNLLQEIEARSHHLRSSFGTSFPAFVRTITSVLQSATTYYNNTRVFHHSGSIPEEQSYFKLYRSRALGDTVSMRRLVVLDSNPALEQAKGLLQALHGTNRFELKVWTSRTYPLDFEMMLTESTVTLAFSNASGEPDYCVRIDDRSFARHLNEFFLAKVWTSPHAETIKPAGKMTGEEKRQADLRLEELRSSLASTEEAPNGAVGDSERNRKTRGSTER